MKRKNKKELVFLFTKKEGEITINYAFFSDKPIKAEIELPVTAFYKRYPSNREAEKAIGKALYGLIPVITDYWNSNIP